jgi:hypothetical protein
MCQRFYPVLQRIAFCWFSQHPPTFCILIKLWPLACQLLQIQVLQVISKFASTRPNESIAYLFCYDTLASASMRVWAKNAKNLYSQKHKFGEYCMSGHCLILVYVETSYVSKLKALLPKD